MSTDPAQSLQDVETLSAIIEPALRQCVHIGLAALAEAGVADDKRVEVSVSAATNCESFGRLVQLVQDSKGLEDWLLSSREWCDSTGEAQWATRSDLTRYVRHFLSTHATRVFSESTFKGCLGDLVTMGTSSTRRWVFTIPLTNLTLVPASASLSLSDKLRIRAVRSEDVGQQDDHHASLALTHCIEATNDSSRRERPSPSSPKDVVASILTTLRLLKAQGVWTSYFWVRSKDPFDRSPFGWRPFSAAGDRGVPLFNHDDGRYLLTESEADSVRALWRRVIASRRADIVTDVVIERFNSAIERFRANPQDSLIDSWIAIEALLLRGVDKAIAETAARRMEALLGTSFDGFPTYDLMRRSYKARSKSVHGELPPEEVREVAWLTLTRLKAALLARILTES